MFEILVKLGSKSGDCAFGVLLMDNVRNDSGVHLKPYKLELEAGLREKYASQPAQI
jgi:hypothetical protein